MSVRRRLSAVFALLILGGGVLVSAAYFALRSSLQTRAGRVELEDLGAEARVAWDAWGIPTISAASELDALRAQGFVHASERLWQLELFQRIARGRLAEVFGEEGLGADRLVRTLDLWGVAGRELEALDPSERARLEAYAGGVNARIRSWKGLWPPEFLLLGIEPEPWSSRASLAIGRIMSLDLAGLRGELDRTSALARLPRDRRAALDPGYPGWGPTITQDDPPPAVADSGLRVPLEAPTVTATVRPDGADAPAPVADGADPLAPLAALGLDASNSWAVGGSRTADGHPLLANDMHLALRAPSTWFVNALRAEPEGYAVAGLSIPGAPGVVVGFNRHLAWGFTNAMVDDVDLVVESINLDGSMYRDPEAWRPFETREETIGVRGRSEPVRHTVRRTRRGPIVTDVLPAGGLTLSLLWTGLEPAGAASALLDMNRARTPAEFERAVERFRSPHQNIIYATTEGTLGYRMSGSVPSRPDGPSAVPVSFERLPNGWERFRPPEEMPALRDPESDWLASANNLQAWPEFGRVGIDYPLPFRARRIADRVSRATDWTVEDMLALQLDTYSLWAERLRPRAVAAARRSGEAALAAALEAWDLRAETDAHGAAPFYAWLYRLRELIASDELAGGTPWFPDIAFARTLEDPDSPWVDDVRTERRERLEELEEEAARTAATVVGPPWGEVHRERSFHPLGEVGWLNRIFRFHVGPYPSRGGRHTVRPDDPGRWAPLDSASWAPPLLSEYGPSERFVAHLVPGAPTGHLLLPTGQSGNPLDPHYRDMSAAWTAGTLVELRLDREPPDASLLELLPPGS